LISQTLGTILQIDDATIAESIFLKCMTHDDILAMGINADIRSQGETMVEHSL
jgi:hypothetical protein